MVSFKLFVVIGYASERVEGASIKQRAYNAIRAKSDFTPMFQLSKFTWKVNSFRNRTILCLVIGVNPSAAENMFHETCYTDNTFAYVCASVCFSCYW